MKMQFNLRIQQHKNLKLSVARNKKAKQRAEGKFNFASSAVFLPFHFADFEAKWKILILI